MAVKQFGLSTCVACALFLATATQGAQPGDGEPAVSRAVAAKGFPRLLTQWNDLDRKLTTVTKEFRAADSDQRDVLRQQYLDLVQQTKDFIPRLRVATVAAYELSPNDDAEVTRTLLGLLANDVHSDDYANAMELARVLVENKCADKALYGLVGVTTYCLHDFETAESYLRKAEDLGTLDRAASGYFKDIKLAQQKWQVEKALRDKEAVEDDLPRVRLQTTKGEIVVELFENEAPQTVANFISLVNRHFYDGLSFHRVLGNFMAQGGCPKGDGTSDAGYKIPCECYKTNHRNHYTGSLSMAHSGRDTGGSQFFITFRPTGHLDGKHTVFGRVVEGLDVLPLFQRRDPERNRVDPDRIIKAEVLRDRSHAYEPTKVKGS